MFQCGINLVRKSVSGTAAPGSLRTAGLDHEVVDHAMKFQAVIKPDSLALARILGPFGKADKVGHRKRGLLKFKPTDNLAFAGRDPGIEPIVKITVRLCLNRPHSKERQRCDCHE